MGNYNPHSPIILGEEWVPIRDEDVVFSPAVNVVELGHEFTTTVARVPTDARFYVHDMPPHTDRGQTYMAAIYPAGNEALSGPISRVIIPCRSALTTGGTISSGAATAADALLTASTSTGITLDTNITNSGIIMTFAVNQYPILSGKRILGVNLLYGGAGTDDIFGAGTASASAILMSTSTNVNPGNPKALFGRFGPAFDINRNKFGEVNQFWTTNSPTSVSERMPWIYTDLQRLDTTATRLYILMTTGTGVNSGTTPSSFCFIFYAALEVIYCEEQRIIVGGAQFGTSFPGVSFGKDTVLGMNALPLRDLTYTANPTLAAGQYLLTISSADVGDINDTLAATTSDYSTLNALRELYQIPPHPGVQLDIPFPVEDRIGEVFTSTMTHILPQTSLHASGGTLTEPHVYGRQAVAQVWGTNTATQDIYDDISGVSASYPQVRYYARRFGDTTVPLTLTGAASLSGSSVAITPGEFDALTEIVDGWKEVTLRFATPPSMGAVAGFPGWTWSASAEVAGNRWEILGASAPAISGTPGNLFNLVPYPNQLGPATYGAGATQTITFISAGTAAHGNNASVVPGMPATIQRGDLLLVLAAIRNSPTGNPDVPTGYTQLLNASNMRLFGKIYDGSESAPTVNFSDGVANATTSAQMAAFRNVTLSVVTSANQLNGSAANIAFPAIASGAMEDNTLVLFLGWREQDWTSVDTIAGATEIGDPSTGTGDNQGIVWDFIVRGPAASVGAGSFVVNGGVNGISRGAVTVLRHADPGAEVELTWMPQGVGSPYVSSPSADATSDAAILFSQDPPNIEIGLSQLTQTVTGIGFDCGSLPCCIPSGIGYQRVTWSAASLAASGFGAYELQRFDVAPGATFETIMLATSPTVTGFNDFEARVGLNSVYRMRVLNLYNFAGSWSNQVTGAPPAPGVTGGCADATGALIFTSNADQSGQSNAAYVMQWDGAPVEDFDLPEGSAVAFQPMYGRDGAVAFHGTERGLETFSRTLLIQAAAIDAIRLADVKTLRDLAWRDLPYVCVRDDIGDRWFSNVRIPTVNARLNRTNYMARVDVVEVTIIPCQVDP
jgi:hypothetical protein